MSNSKEKKITHINLAGVSSVGAAGSRKAKKGGKGRSARRKPSAGAGRKFSGGARPGR